MIIRTKKINEDIKEMDTVEYKFSKMITENAIMAIIQMYEEIGMEVLEVIEYIRTTEDINEHIDAKFIIKWKGKTENHTWQIKVLTKLDWKDNFTIEFMQDRYRRVLGEVAEIKAHLYFHSYYNEEENYLEYHVINVDAFKKWFNVDLALREVFERPAGGSNASFYYRRYDAFHPNSKVIVRQGKFACI